MRKNFRFSRVFFVIKKTTKKKIKKNRPAHTKLRQNLLSETTADLSMISGRKLVKYYRRRKRSTNHSKTNAFIDSLGI